MQIAMQKSQSMVSNLYLCLYEISVVLYNQLAIPHGLHP